MNCDGAINYGDINAFVLAMNNRSDYEAQYPNCNWLNGDTNGDGTVNYGDINTFNGLFYGGGNAALTQTYEWDGGNRLIRVGPTAGTGVPEGAKKAEYAYDYLGRRVQTKVWTYAGGNWGSPVERRYVWSGWLLLMELDGNVAVVRKYTWGLDLAGQNGAGASERAAQASAFLESAGGIGGLLAVSDPNDPTDPNDPFGDFVYFYDGNGNVGQVVDLAHDANDPAGALVAKYEYDPYGQRINHDPNVPEYDQPWRFSTHQFDAETGLLYAKRRYFSPGLGRFVSHDPIGEMTSYNLYVYVANTPTTSIDPFGLWGYDLHHDLTLELAQRAGICCAGAVGAGTQRPDDDVRNAPEAFKEALLLLDLAERAKYYAPEYAASLQAEAFRLLRLAGDWHFPASPNGMVEPGSDAAKAKVNEGLGKCNFRRFSEGLHVLQDSWSHQGKPFLWGVGHYRGARWVPAQVVCLPDGCVGFPGGWVDVSGTSEAALSPGADDVTIWAADARAAALATYDALLQFKKACPCACPCGGDDPSKNCCPTSCGPAQDPADVAKWLENEKYPGKNKIP